MTCGLFLVLSALTRCIDLLFNCWRPADFPGLFSVLHLHFPLFRASLFPPHWSLRFTITLVSLTLSQSMEYQPYSDPLTPMIRFQTFPLRAWFLSIPFSSELSHSNSSSP